MAHSNSDQDPAGQERLVEEVTQKLGILEGDKEDEGSRPRELGSKGMGDKRKPGSWGPECGIAGTLILSPEADITEVSRRAKQQMNPEGLRVPW